MREKLLKSIKLLLILMLVMFSGLVIGCKKDPTPEPEPDPIVDPEPEPEPEVSVLEGIKFESAEIVYDGAEHELVIADLPGGVTATYSENKGTEVGKYYATVTLKDDKGEEKELRAILKITTPDDPEFTAWLDEMLVYIFEGDTFSINVYFANPEDFGFENYEGEWTSYQEFTMEQVMEDFQPIIDGLAKFDKEKLSFNQQIAYREISQLVDSAISSYETGFNYMKVNYISKFGGEPADLPSSMTGYIFRRAEDVEDLIEIIDNVDEAFPTYIEYGLKRIELGYPLSDYTIDEMIKYLEGVVEKGDDYYLNDYFDKTIGELEFLTQEQKDTYLAQIHTILRGSYIEAHRKLAEDLVQLKGHCEEEGYQAVYGDVAKEQYVKLLEKNLGYENLNLMTYSKFLDSQISLAVKGINKAISDGKNLTSKEYTKFYNVATGGYAFVEGTPEEMVEFLKTFAPNIVCDLKSTPNIHISIMDKTVGEYSNAVAYYMNSAIDSYTDEYITLNPVHLEDDMNDTLATLAHEGYPGHLYAYVYAKQLGLHPLNIVLKNLTHGEGWATYVELKLFEYLRKTTKGAGYKAGIDYLYYNTLLSYLVYSRADFGINYEGWDITKVMNYFNAQGFSLDESKAQELYRTLIEVPANYPAYGYGMAKFRQLHLDIEKALGEGYDEIETNKVFLGHGWVDMEILEQLVDEFIEDQKYILGIE